MDVLNFALGLLIGLSGGLWLWLWQRSRAELRLRSMVRTLDSDVAGTPLSSVSQLSIAIAHQQKFQHRLEQEIESNKQILQIAPLGYLQVDDENRLLWCNAQARKLLEIHQDNHSDRYLNQSQTQTQSQTQSQNPNYSQTPYPVQPRLLLEVVRSYELDDLIDATREAGQPCQVDWMFHPVHTDPSTVSTLSKQSPYPLRGHAFPLPNQEVGVFIENRQEAEMLRQQRDRWASDLAHELKTPLTSIRLVAETLQMRLHPPLQIWCDRLINETIRLSTLVQDLLDLTQIERDATQRLRLETIDLVELIHSVWNSLEPLACHKQLRLKYEGLLQLEAQLDRARIYRLLVNLLDNSIKYSPAHHPILVRLQLTDPPHRQIHLEVIDAGGGFAEKDLPYVFERFYRADISRTRLPNSDPSLEPHTHRYERSAPGIVNPPGHEKGDQIGSQPLNPIEQKSAKTVSMATHQNGSGLGLAIVRQIAEAHQGSVTADNHPETGGAWMQVYLPFLGRESGDEAIDT